jgi:transposase
MPPPRRRSKNQFGATLEARRLPRVFAFDEARFGLKVWHHRRWCPFGARPPWVHEDRYQWLWLYAAVEPVSGACVVLFLPHTDSACLDAFLAAFRQAVPEGPIGLVLDGSGSHGSARVRWPAGVQPLRLPRYSPELNPAERWFEALRQALANRLFDNLAELEQMLTETLQPYWDDPAKLARLTGYPWWINALHNITSP